MAAGNSKGTRCRNCGTDTRGKGYCSEKCAASHEVKKNKTVVPLDWE